MSNAEPVHHPRIATVGNNGIDVLRHVTDGRVARRVGSAEARYFGAVGTDRAAR